MTRTWQEIAAEAAKEKDSRKLMKLTMELESALEERDKGLHKPARSSDTAPPQREESA
jgi:hypothetical protein